MNSALKLRNLPKLLRPFSSLPECEEIKIPVPWGHIAGKWWGPQDKQPILVLHGWQENCGTFDRLIPMLNPKYAYLAIDFPGHGLSSHLPAGTSYYWIDYAITIRRVVKHFKWSKVSILGHSLGGSSGYYYECIYPGQLNYLITIDALRPTFNKSIMEVQGERIDLIIKYDHYISQGKEGPAYTKEELAERLYEDSGKTINLDLCQYILERNIKESKVTPNKYYVTRDMRLKVFPILKNSQSDILQNINKLLCPILYFKATISAPKYAKVVNVEDVTDVLKQTKKDFEMHVVEGTHHVHLNNPEILEARINQFIEKYTPVDN